MTFNLPTEVRPAGTEGGQTVEQAGPALLHQMRLGRRQLAQHVARVVVDVTQAGQVAVQVLLDHFQTARGASHTLPGTGTAATLSKASPSYMLLPRWR